MVDRSPDRPGSEDGPREVRADGMPAQYLIPFRSLLEAFMACSETQGMAEFLNVDVELIYARTLDLDPLESVMLVVCTARCVGIELSTLHPGGALVA